MKLNILVFISTTIVLSVPVCYLFSIESGKQINPGQEKIGSETFLTVKDSRDGQTYSAVKLNGLWWFAENLRFETPHSYCYGDDSVNCGIYGRLYLHKDILSACPEGWRLPAPSEFDKLLAYLKNENMDNSSLIDPDFWTGRKRDSTSNYTGLSIRASGWKIKKKYSGLGSAAHLWLSDPEEPGKVHHIHMGGELVKWGKPDLPYRHNHNNIRNKRYFSCRCVKEAN